MLIVCVLKSGKFKNLKNEYTQDSVYYLKSQIDKNTTLVYDFVCLTDLCIEGVQTISLNDNLPGWWSKIELFREFRENTLYFDLDTVILKNIDVLLTEKDGFYVLKNLTEPQSDKIGSGVMKWNGDYSHIYNKFMQKKDEYMQIYTTSEKWGDQGFIKDNIANYKYLQEHFPSKIVSYKVDLKKKHAPAPENSIVCFHGNPKPFDVINKHDWMPKWTA